jgi:large subunit ribosomal protein L21
MAAPEPPGSSPQPGHAPTPMSESPTASTYAIVEASGQQFWLEPNRYVDLDRIAAEVDSTVTLENVLLIKDSSGTTLGQPYVKGASVELKVLAHRRGQKILVYKMRPKKKTRRKNGHRQELTRVLVQSITVGGKAIA